MVWEDHTLVLLHNLASEPVQVPFALSDEGPGTLLMDLMVDDTFELDGESSTEARLDGFGSRWLRIKREGDPRLV